MALTWKSNYWIKKEVNLGWKTGGPELSYTKLKHLLHETSHDNEIFLGRRGIVLRGDPSVKKFYMDEPFIYFEDSAGLFAIHFSMFPNEQNKISYYEWYQSPVNGSWRKFENMSADE